MSVGRIGKLSPLDSPELRNSVDQIPLFNLRRSMNRDLRRLGGARCRNPRSSSSGWTQLPRAKIGGIGLVSELFLVFRDANARTLFAFLAFSPPPFLVRSFWFFFGNVLSFSSPTTSGRSFLEQGSEESVFFPTQFSLLPRRNKLS